MGRLLLGFDPVIMKVSIDKRYERDRRIGYRQLCSSNRSLMYMLISVLTLYVCGLISWSLLSIAFGMIATISVFMNLNYKRLAKIYKINQIKHNSIELGKGG